MAWGIPPVSEERQSLQIHRRTATSLRRGQKVIIRFNPHLSGVNDAPGTIVTLQPGTGFGGCDLAIVRYRHPATRRYLARPISLAFLAPLTTP